MAGWGDGAAAGGAHGHTAPGSGKRGATSYGDDSGRRAGTDPALPCAYRLQPPPSSIPASGRFRRRALPFPFRCAGRGQRRRGRRGPERSVRHVPRGRRRPLRCGGVRAGVARLGSARQSTARYGTARHGTVAAGCRTGARVVATPGFPRRAARSPLSAAAPRGTAERGLQLWGAGWSGKEGTGNGPARRIRAGAVQASPVPPLGWRVRGLQVVPPFG